MTFVGTARTRLTDRRAGVASDLRFAFTGPDTRHRGDPIRARLDGEPACKRVRTRLRCSGSTVIHSRGQRRRAACGPVVMVEWVDGCRLSASPASSRGSVGELMPASISMPQLDAARLSRARHGTRRRGGRRSTVGAGSSRGAVRDKRPRRAGGVPAEVRARMDVIGTDRIGSGSSTVTSGSRTSWLQQRHGHGHRFRRLRLQLVCTQFAAVLYPLEGTGELGERRDALVAGYRRIREFPDGRYVNCRRS